MNSEMDKIVIIMALAIYEEMGVIQAIAYMHMHGFTIEMAHDVLEIFDRTRDHIKRTGQAPD
jgi:hypothetical protein